MVANEVLHAIPFEKMTLERLATFELWGDEAEVDGDLKQVIVKAKV